MFRRFFFFFYSPSVVSRKESETRRSRNNKIWEAEYSKRFGLPPSKYIIRVYFTLVAPCVSRRRGELAERIPRIFVSPNRGEFFALPGPLCAAILLFSFPPSRFFLCGLARPTRVESPPGNSVISWKILDGEGGLNREPWILTLYENKQLFFSFEDVSYSLSSIVETS